MKRKWMSILFGVLLCLLLPSCLSTAISQMGKDDVAAANREEAMKHYGRPIVEGKLSKNDPLQKVSRTFHPEAYWLSGRDERKGALTYYEIYRYRGMLKDQSMSAMGYVMIGVMTLGLSELVFVPHAIAGRISASGKTHYYFAGYEGEDDLTFFARVAEKEIADRVGGTMAVARD
ncbi:MAG: hypothetical protein ACON38_05625 [Akkermansiaceae bacterium]